MKRVAGLVVLAGVIGAGTFAARLALAEDTPQVPGGTPEMVAMPDTFEDVECMTRRGFNTISQAYITRFSKSERTGAQLGGFANATLPGVYFTCQDLVNRGSYDFFVDANDTSLVTMLTLMPTQKSDPVRMYSLVYDKAAPLRSCKRQTKNPCYRVLALDYY